MTNEQPLIWTTKGNIPLAGLRHDTEWRVSPEQVIFIERYWLGDEVVKESTHVNILTGAAAIGAAGAI